MHQGKLVILNIFDYNEKDMYSHFIDYFNTTYRMCILCSLEHSFANDSSLFKFEFIDEREVTDMESLNDLRRLQDVLQQGVI